MGAFDSKYEKGHFLDISFSKVSRFIVEIDKCMNFTCFSGARNEKVRYPWSSWSLLRTHVGARIFSPLGWSAHMEFKRL